MKKSLFTVILVAVAAVSASAQSAVGSVYVKPMAGGVLSTFAGSDSDGAEMKFGLVAGAELGYQISNQVALTGGLLYTMQGCSMDTEGDPKMKLDYLNIPLLANFYVAPRLALKAGVQPGILLSANASASGGGVSADIDVSDAYNTFDLSIPLGISYEFNNFIIDARYNLGLTKVEKTSATIAGKTISNPYNNVKNSVIMLTVGYKIPL